MVREYGAVHKRRPQTGGFIQCGQGGLFRGGKLSIFRNLWYGKSGHFVDKE